MKAQFATIEAGMALAMVISAVAFVSNLANTSTSSISTQASLLQRNVALYDIVNALERNSTYGSCALEPSCLTGMELNFSSVFGVGNISIGTRTAQISGCVNIVVSNQTLYACISG